MAQLTSMHFYGWKKGLKTGMVSPAAAAAAALHKLTFTQQYYLRSRAAVGAIKFTIDQATLSEFLGGSTASVHPYQPPSHLDKAKADSKKAIAPGPVVDKPSPIRDITNGMAKSSLSAGPSLTKRFDSSSTSVSPANSPTPSTPVTAEPATPTPATAAPATPATAQVNSTGEEELTYEEAVQRREERELEQAKLLCSLENKEACVMCSG